MIGLEELQEHINSISEEDWNKLFFLIPKIEQAKSFGKMVTNQEVGPGVTQFSYVSYDSLVLEFLEIVYQLKLIVAFDWMDWTEGRKILDKQDYKGKDIITLCKLLTIIIRADRFSEGFLLSTFKHGDILAILMEMKIKI